MAGRWKAGYMQKTRTVILCQQLAACLCIAPRRGHHDDGSLTRNDTGVAEGDTISIYYDPMIAKLCSWAGDRSAAIARMRLALDDFVMRGIGHNIPFLSAVMEHDRFLAAISPPPLLMKNIKATFRASPTRQNARSRPDHCRRRS